MLCKMIASFITILLFCNTTLLSYEASTPFELNLKNNRWNAQVIAVKDSYKKSYISSQSTLSEINFYHYALAKQYNTDIHVSTFSNKSEFGWIDQRIGNEWAEFWYPYEIHFSVKQSLPHSKWSINGKKFEINGSTEQDIAVKMGRMSYRLDTLIFKSETPGNNLVFSSVKIVRPSLIRYFRKNIVINKNVINSELVISTSPNYKLYINGKLIAEKGAGSVFNRVYNTFTITPYLQQGNNCIALECESCDWENMGHRIPDFCNEFFLEGIIIFASGNFRRIYSDASWKATYIHEDGWNRTNYDDSSWNHVDALGNVGRTISGFPNDGKGFYTNPPYMGPIIIELPNKDHPFFSESEPLDFSIGAYLEKQNATDSSCICTIYNFISSEKITTFELHKKTYHYPKLAFEFPKLTFPQGSYLLEITLKNSNTTIDTRHFEFLVLGKITDNATATKTSNEMQLVDSINCSNLFSLQPFISAPFLLLKQNTFGFFSRLIQTPFGNYRETKPGLYAWLSYKFKVKNLYKPHLISIYYPDNLERTMGIVIHEKPFYQTLHNIPKNDAVLRCSSGIYTGDTMETTSQIRKLDFLYWPNVNEATISFINYDRKQGVAVKKIELYEFNDGLPELSINNNLNQMLIGTMSERAYETLPRTFYAGELKNKFIQNLNQSDFMGYYKAWYITLKNFIKYMKYSGQNLFVPSGYMYYGAKYPCAFSGLSETGIQLTVNQKKDYLALMATMFEHNNLSLFLGIEFMGTKQTRNEYDNCTDINLRDTTQESLRLVSKNGTQCYTSWGCAGLTPTHPENVNKYLSVINDCASKYKDYPAIKGFVLYANGGLFPSFGSFSESNPKFLNNSLDWGYGDFTIREFENDTGITIPVNNTAPDRFSQRYHYIMNNYQTTWISWREQKIRTILLQANKIIRNYRNDWETKIISLLPHNNDVPDIMKNNVSIKEMFLKAGFAPDIYKHEKSTISCAPMIRASGARMNRIVKQNYTSNFLINTYNTSEELGSLFDFDEFSTAFIYTGFYPECILTTEKPWLWENAFCLSYPLPPDNYYLQPFTETMALFSPSTMILFLTDITHQVGHEKKLAEFTKVYLTLPKIDYNTIMENDSFAVKGNVWKNHFYFFIINKKHYTQIISLNLKKNYQVLDLVNNTCINVSNNKFIITLGEHEMKTYKIENCNELQIQKQ